MRTLITICVLEFRGGKAPKMFIQNRKVHLNKFFLTISAGLLTHVTWKQADVRVSLFHNRILLYNRYKYRVMCYR